MGLFTFALSHYFNSKKAMGKQASVPNTHLRIGGGITYNKRERKKDKVQSTVSGTPSSNNNQQSIITRD